MNQHGTTRWEENTGSCAYLIVLVHLVKLINAADAVVRKHHCTSFNHELIRILVLHHSGRQTGCCRCFARSVHSARHELCNVFQELQSVYPSRGQQQGER
jgi:hypothetical protein